MKLRFYFPTLRANLFFYQSLLIVLIILLAGAVSYTFFSSNYEKNIFREQDALGTSLVSSLENEFDKLNTVSMNISYSNLLKNLFSEYQELHKIGKPKANNTARYNDLSLLFDSIMTVMGPFHTVSQVNLFTLDGLMIGSGLYNEEAFINLYSYPGLREALALNGLKYLSTPRKIKYLSRRNLHLKDHRFISLIRVFKDQYYQNEGVVEVLQDCEDFFSYTDLLQSRNHLKIVLIGRGGEIFYPYREEDLSYLKDMPQDLSESNQHALDEGTSLRDANGRLIYSIFPIEGYPLRLILMQSKAVLFSSLHRFQIIFLFFLLFVTAYTIIISYSVSVRVTRPLNRLVNSLSGVKLNKLAPGFSIQMPEAEESFTEIDTLYSAFISLSGKLGSSLHELIQLKDQEALTRLLALQSQMNPHFLYNNLSNISVLAEEGKNGEVIGMCRDLSYMLRYSAEKVPKGASIREEMDYVGTYLKCMKIRYEEDLEFSISYPPGMSDIIIPRILVQPLVENSINHGFHTAPPWIIEVSGEMEGDQWSIRVRDNGRGFPDRVLDQFRENGASPVESEHLGLNNTRQRIRLIYGNRGVFHLENNPEGGACVTISGHSQYRADLS